MGVQIGEATGKYPTLLQCKECSERYETDETMGNDCPHCYSHRFEMIGESEWGYDPSNWRDE